MIVYSNNNHYITKAGLEYYVWIPGLTHSILDDSYLNMDIAKCRCDYLQKVHSRSDVFKDEVLTKL